MALMDIWNRRSIRLMRLLGVVGGLSLLTIVCAYVLRINPSTVGFVYLLATLITATKWGLLEAVTASVISTVCYNFFFLPPVHTFRIADPQNWVALFTFLVTSLVTSQLSERAKRRTAEAVARQQELQQLHTVGRAILLSDGAEPLGQKLVSEIARTYGTTAAAIYDRATGETFYEEPERISPDVEQKLRNTAANGGTFRDEKAQSLVTAFGLQGKPQGSLALIGTPVTGGALESLSNLVAIGLEKARNQETANRAEAARQTQEFKSTLLEALAHEFKTPLTTIKAAASALLTPEIADPGHRRELTTAIEQETDRLAALVTEVTHLARVEAGMIRLDKQPCEVSSLIQAVLKQMEAALIGRTMNVAVSDGLPRVMADREMMQLVLRHLIDNAVKYSAPHSPIQVRVEQSRDFVRVAVWNDGQAVPAWERPRLFEKFYRGTTAGAQTTGTGMGLAIAKEIVSAHGGELRLESSVERGTEVSVDLPALPEGTAA